MTECYCDYESTLQMAKTATPVARKAHRCTECRGPIAPGEKYEYVTGFGDGRFEKFKVCQRCQALRAYVVAHVPCACWGYGAMIEDLLETAQNWAREAPGLLFGAYRRKVLIDRARRAAA